MKPSYAFLPLSFTGTGLGLVALVAIACGPSDGTGDPTGDGGPSGGADAPVVGSVCTPNASESCYNGPPGTENVGPCQGGMRTCFQDGTGWGACNGEVIPSAEICTNGIDDDCDTQIDTAADYDGDGYTRCTGDCCELTSECGDPIKVNPGSAEAPTMMGGIAVDDDCDGTVDELEPPCDGAYAIDDVDAMHAANVIGLCKIADSVGGGLISASYIRADGTPAGPGQQAGLLNDFGPGVMVREGTQLVALSSGRGRRAADPGACGALTCTGSGAGTAPAGFPQDVPGCAGGTNINDDVGLELRLRAPANATGFSVDFAFYSFEYPEWVCTTFNDQFIVKVEPPPMGSINGNIAFDSMTNPVSVNVAFFEVCAGCSMGTAALQGTGFDVWNDAGATVWLRSQAPITGGQEFTVQLTIWDTGDSAWDSTVIADNFQWILSGSPGVETNPIP